MKKLPTFRVYWAYSLAPVIAVSALAVWAHEFVSVAVARNPVLNLSILGVIAAGAVIAIFTTFSFQREGALLRKFISRYREAKTLEGAYAQLPESRAQLREIFKFLAKSGGRINGPMIQSVLHEEVERYRENLTAQLSLPTFLSGFMIALGLFGTFVGLLETLTSAGQLISGVAAASDSDASASVMKLVKGIQAPLLGMGTAFSASLFGLLGSLLLGAMLNALQALSRSIRNHLHHFLEEVTVIGAESPEQGLTHPMMSMGLTQDFLADFLAETTSQHKQAVTLFQQSRESDNEVVSLLASISTDIRDQIAEQRRVCDAQEVLNQALTHQLETMDGLRSNFTALTRSAEAMEQSHREMVSIGETTRAAVEEVKRLVVQQTDVQARVVQTERRTSELFEILHSGILALGERDMVLRDMQRAAIDSVKHASKIGMKLNEDAVGQFQVRIAIKEQVESALYQFTEFRNEQARTLTALTDGLRDLMRTIDRRNGEVINLISNQPLGSSDLRDAVNQLPQSLEAAHSSLQAQAEFSRSLVDELRALREAGRR